MRKIVLSCGTKNLDEYKRAAQIACELGATHMGISKVEKSLWQWDMDRYDPYPNWGTGMATLFKIIVPDKLKPFLPIDYAKRNLETIAKRAEILKEFGLGATFNGCEPAWLPEEVYREYPTWRGPRCDQPRRARREYYAPCVDNPEVRAMYVQTVKELCTVAPIEYFSLLANDSGGGLCWSENLYPGKNGPKCCEHISIGDRIVDFLSAIQEGAALAGLEAEAGFGAIFYENEISSAVPKLKPGQFICNNTVGGRTMSKMVGNTQGYDNLTFPMYEMPQLVKFTRMMQNAKGDNESNIAINLPSVDNKEYYFHTKQNLNKIGDGPKGIYDALTETAANFVGKKSADKLVEVWDLLDRGVEMMAYLHNGGHILNIGSVHQRWITRPFVAFPNELKPEEKDYYRNYQFQATTEADADNMLNMQASRYIIGHSGMFLVARTIEPIIRHYNRAISLIDEMIEEIGDIDYKKDLKTLKLKFRMLGCLLENVMNVCKFQTIIDRTDYTVEPKDDEYEIWYEQGDIRLYNIKKVFRDEIDNTLEMIEILESAEDKILMVAPTEEQEDVMILGPDIINDLKKKITIMENHRDDFNRLYTCYNR